jgi:hypothetical protein
VVIDVIDTDLGEFTAPGLGCVDSAPFFNNTPGARCGAGSGGAGGAGGGGGGGESSGGASGGVGGAGL